MEWKKVKRKTGIRRTKRVPEYWTRISRTVGIVNREDWLAVKCEEGNQLELPVTYVGSGLTHTDVCTSARTCRALMRDLQLQHIHDANLTDISYNFVVGGDLNLYEGRGWKVSPQLQLPYSYCNSSCVYIALSARVEDRQQILNMEEARRKLIEYGVENSFIKPDYTAIHIK